MGACGCVFVCMVISLMSVSLARQWLLADNSFSGHLCSLVSRGSNIQLTCRKLGWLADGWTGGWMDEWMELPTSSWK